MDLSGQPSGRGVEGGQIEVGDREDRDVEVSGSTSKNYNKQTATCVFTMNLKKAFGI